VRTIGLIGGMSWESTALYYRYLNEGVRTRLGGLHSAELVLRSIDFANIAAMQASAEWDRAGDVMAHCAQALERAGAEAILLCTNTMHLLAPAIEAATTLPLLHIADATGTAITAAGCRRPALLATRFTMEQDFYASRLRRQHGLQPCIPTVEARAEIHRVIYEELCQGVVNPDSKARYLAEIETLQQEQGIDSVILGCTEIGMLLGEADLDLPVFDSTRLHAEAGVDFMLTKAR
jgi:aspartate racemase